MEEEYELDLTYITERIIAVSFPRGCSEEIYSHNLKDVTRMLKSKHADNYLIINLSERRHDLTKMNPKTLDTGWPDLHAPPLDKICTICKAMESWLNADPLHVVVIHCRGGKGRIGVVISSFVHFTDVSSRFIKTYVHSFLMLSIQMGKKHSLLALFFLFLFLFFFFLVFAYTDRVCINLEPAQLLKGDIMIKCYHKSDVTSEREVIFRLQFHTGAVQGYNLMFEKEDMESANKDPRFPDYGKVELVFSEGPERIPGADRWQNGPDVIVDYNTADPLTRWDSYKNICDGEGTDIMLQPPCRSVFPDHSDHALSVSSDSGLSSTSLWVERPTPVPTTTSNNSCSSSTIVKANQGPSPQEKVQLKQLLSGFGLDDPSLDEMDEPDPKLGLQQTLPAQLHFNGDTQPRERETDILDDEVNTAHDLHSVDSLGTLSSSCHKSSQNSLLSDGFGFPGSEEQQNQHHLHHTVPQHMDDFERSYAEARRAFMRSRNNSEASCNPSSAPTPKQHVYRQGSYSTQSWVRQQQMVAAQQFNFMPEEGNDTERYSAVKPGSSSPKEGLANQPQNPIRDKKVDTVKNTAPYREQPATNNNNKNNKHDEEIKSLTMDIDNSIDQLNQLIMDLDPTFVPKSGLSKPAKRDDGTQFNGLVGEGSNSIDVRFNDCNTATLKTTQQTGKIAGLVPASCIMHCLLQHTTLCRSNSTSYRGPGPGDTGGTEGAIDQTPPTPAFPISPPTPYEHHVLTRHSSLSNHPSARQPILHSVSLDYGHHSPPLHHPHAHPAPNAHSSPRNNQRGRTACYALGRSPQCFDEQDGPFRRYGKDCLDIGIERDVFNSMEGQHQSQVPQPQPPLLPEKKRASDGEHSLGTASPALSGFSSPHSGSSLSIPFPNVLPDLSAQTPRAASPLPGYKQVTVKFVQDTSKFWYKPDISRDQAISVLKDKEPGSFIVRDSHSFKGAYGLALKVATPPPSVIQQSRKGGDLTNELVRHFLIECTQKGVRLKGCPNEPYFGSLTALVYQHSITPLALPCKLIIPDRDPLEDVVENISVTNSAAELLKQGAACNVWYLGSVEMESLTGVQAVQKATSMTLDANPPPVPTVVHFKVSSQGITLTDNQRKLFFRRHYNVNTVIFCALDPQDRKWKKDGCASAKIFGFVARKTGTSTDNVCHLFAEHDPEQPASAIVNFVSKVMIGSQRSK
uniref:Tensin 3 n=1 Tax=Fundulus heteroclitus TaxID=8078 RepID=A0A3Q2PKI1_FUNHE